MPCLCVCPLTVCRAACPPAPPPVHTDLEDPDGLPSMMAQFMMTAAEVWASSVIPPVSCVPAASVSLSPRGDGLLLVVCCLLLLLWWWWWLYHLACPFRMPSAQEAPTRGWLRKYLRQDIGSGTYNAFSKVDLIWCVFSYFSWRQVSSNSLDGVKTALAELVFIAGGNSTGAKGVPVFVCPASVYTAIGLPQPKPQKVRCQGSRAHVCTVWARMRGGLPSTTCAVRLWRLAARVLRTCRMRSTCMRSLGDVCSRPLSSCLTKQSPKQPGSSPAVSVGRGCVLLLLCAARMQRAGVVQGAGRTRCWPP